MQKHMQIREAVIMSYGYGYALGVRTDMIRIVIEQRQKK